MEVAVSTNKQHVVVAHQGSFETSHDDGATLGTPRRLDPNFPIDGDSSVAFGVSGLRD